MGFLEGGFCKNVRLSWLWRSECQMHCWAQSFWVFCLSLGVPLNSAETPFAKPPSLKTLKFTEKFFRSVMLVVTGVVRGNMTGGNRTESPREEDLPPRGSPRGPPKTSERYTGNHQHSLPSERKNLHLNSYRIKSVSVSVSLERINSKQIRKCKCKFGGCQFGVTWELTPEQN